MEVSRNVFFEKFSGDNFPTWQTKIRLLLMRDGVWNIVKGTDEKPEGAATALDVKAWNDRNDKALAHIGLGLADNLIHHLDLDKTAKEVWDKLENLFGNKINNSKVFLKQKYYGLKMKQHHTLQEHLSNIGSLLHQLTALNAHIDEDDKKAVLFSSTEEIQKYKGVISSLRVTREMAYDSMVAILIDEDRRLQDEAATEIDLEKSFYSKTNIQKGKKGKTMKCTYCQKLGHTEERCFKKMVAQQSKENANLVEDEDEDKDEARTSSTPESALTVFNNLSLHEEDSGWAF